MATIKASFSHRDRDGLTLQEIAIMMDLTKERVRQIEERALMKVRRDLAKKNLTPSEFIEGVL